MPVFNHLTNCDVIKLYEEHSNYKIINLDNKYDTTVVYLSSNAVYYPNTLENFKYVMIEKSRFEWTNAKHHYPFANKVIYLRDVFKQWYLKGINKEINTLDKLAEFIKQEHNNTKLVLIGFSAGGYAATILGCLLDADAVYSFAGQFTLEPVYKKSNRTNKDIIVNKEYTSIYNPEKLLRNSKVDIFYFVCFNSEIDQPDIEIAKRNNVNTFFIDCKMHGIPFSSLLLKYIFSMKTTDLAKLSNFNILNKTKFHKYFLSSFKYYYLYILNIYKQMPKYLKKKFCERIHK